MHFGGAYGTAGGNSEPKRQQEYRGPPMLDAMIRARDEMNKGYYSSACTILKGVLEQDEKFYHQQQVPASQGGASSSGSSSSPTANKPSPLTGKQLERIYMLLADCRYYNKNYEQALSDSEEAIKASKSRTPQPYFVKGRVLLAMLRVPESLDAFEMAEILMASPPPVVTDVPASPKNPSPKLAHNGHSGHAPDGTILSGGSAGEKSSHVSTEEVARLDGWAQVGVDPAKAPGGSDALAVDDGDGTGTGGGSWDQSSGPKEVQVTYEWVQELESWRKSATEAKALGSMLQTHTIPRNVLQIGALVLRKKVDEVSRRSIVLLVQNDTPHDITMRFNHFFDGTFLANHNFPNRVKPGEVGIAAVHNNSWKGTVKGVVGFSFGGDTDDGVLCCFENPLISNYRSDVRCCSLKGMDFNRSSSNGRQQLTLKSAVSSITSGKVQYKAIADVSPSAVQKFTITTVKRAQLKPVDLVAVLEFCPSIHLKKCTTVNKLFRNILNSFPPQAFTDQSCTRRAYPDYCCTTDLDQNPFTVPDKEVTWRLQRDLSGPYDRDEFAAYDNNNNRVFTLITDLGSRSLTISVHYNYRKCQSLTLIESWMPLSKTAELKIGTRNVGKFELKDSVLRVAMDAYMSKYEDGSAGTAGGGKPAGSVGGGSGSSSKNVGGSPSKSNNVPSGHGVYYSVRHNGTGNQKPTQCSIRMEDAGPEIASLHILADNGSRKSQPVCELTMNKGADALLCVLLAFYSRARFAGSFP